jgi:hypothetical protein
MKYFILVISGNAILLAIGILMIFIPSIIFNNYWSLLSILLFLVSFIFPILCNAFRFDSAQSSDSYLFSDGHEAELGGMISWFVMGIFITMGYSIPFELWRTKLMNPIGMGMTMGGGTIILASILLFSQVVYKTMRDQFNF